MRRALTQGRLKVASSRLCGSDSDPAEHSADVVRHGHQASADRSETVAAQQVESQCPQQSQHLNTVALGVAVSVLTQLGVAGPVPLVFDCPALAHKSQQRFRAGAQGGDKEVNVVKRLAVTPADAHQLDDPAGSSPALTDGACGIAGSELPAHLGDDLLVKPALVVFDSQEQACALLGGELKNAGEVWSASA